MRNELNPIDIQPTFMTRFGVGKGFFNKDWAWAYTASSDIKLSRHSGAHL